MVPVVYNDANKSSSLNVDKATGKPSEDFGTGGEATFNAPAASSATDTGNLTVVSVDKANNQFTATDGTNYAVYSYDSNDTFSDSANGPVTMSGFEGELSQGDLVDAAPYASDSSLSSHFTITNKYPQAPANVTATQDGSKVTVSWDKATNADSYNVYRATAKSGDNCTTLKKSDFTKIGSSTTTSYDDSSVTVPTDTSSNYYCYTVTTVSDGEESGISSSIASSPTQVTKPAADSKAPFTADAQVSKDNGFATRADSGDVWKLTFDEPVSAASGARILVDGTGSNSTVVQNGDNATFAVSGNTLTVTLTKDLTFGSGTTAVPAGYPLTISNSSGITDAAGNRWDTNKGDVTVQPTASDSDAVNLTTGKAYTSVASAASDASANDTIAAYGTYGSAASGDNVTVSDNGVTIEGNGDGVLNGTITIAANGVKVDGLAVNSGTHDAIFANDGVTGFTVSNDTLTGVAAPAKATAGQGHGVVSVSGSQPESGTISGNTIQGFTTGVVANTGTTFTIKNNKIVNNYVGVGATEKATITGNTISDNSFEGIGLLAAGSTVTGNSFANNGANANGPHVDQYGAANNYDLNTVIANNSFDEPVKVVTTNAPNGATASIVDNDF